MYLKSFLYLLEYLLQSGISAPIPPPPDPGNPLITSGGNVNDDTKQISVQLALKRWLCNTTNGDPNEWGVVVAHKDQAIGMTMHI